MRFIANDDTMADSCGCPDTAKASSVLLFFLQESTVVYLLASRRSSSLKVVPPPIILSQCDRRADPDLFLAVRRILAS